MKVKEGPQYRLGEIKVTGNTVFTDREIRQRVVLIPGMIVNDVLLQASTDRIRTEYANRGYIYALVTRSVTRHEGNIADVTIEIDEDKAYKADRIDFEGNSVTRDAVLRREMRLSEGDLLSRNRLDLSGYKIQQLGFVKPDPDPYIEPVEGTANAKIRVKIEEQGRNEIQVGGGYSPSEGLFFQGSYSTRNFLGRGEIVSVSMQLGGISKRYALSFQEPWFMGKPYTLGVSVFRRDYQYATNQNQTGNGASVLVGRQLTDFSHAQMLLSFESVTYSDSNVRPADNISATSTTKIGSVTPTYSYDRVDNPFRPTHGRSIYISSQIAGSVLLGSNDFWKPMVNITQYLPAIRRSFFGLHASFGYIVPYGSGAAPGSGQILDIPTFERFFIGGDMLGPRVFQTRSISPIEFVSRDGMHITQDRNDIVRYKRVTDPSSPLYGHKFQVYCDLRYDFSPTDGLCNALSLQRIGGSRFLLGQFEFAVPIAQPVTLAFFLDAGTAYAENQKINFDIMRVSTGVELRIFLPVFQAPIRFILGQPLRQAPGDATNNFQFSIGTSF